MLSRVTVWTELPFHPLIWVKLPTAYMTPLHATICLICSVVPFGASAGVPVAGVGDTGPLCAAAIDGIRPAALAVSAHKAATGALHSNQRLTPCIMPPFAPHNQRGRQSPGGAAPWSFC